MDQNLRPKVSIVVPIHDMKNGEFFFWRIINSIMSQTYKNYEIIITKEGKMAENTNAGIKRATGEIIKILYLDDYFSHPDSLEKIVKAFEMCPGDHWVMTGTNDNPDPRWTDDIHTGNNKLGSPSALAMRNESPLLFDEKMSWLLDCDLYKRLSTYRGKPVLLSGDYVTIGKGDHQMTHILTEPQKVEEHIYMRNKYK